MVRKVIFTLLTLFHICYICLYMHAYMSTSWRGNAIDRAFKPAEEPLSSKSTKQCSLVSTPRIPEEALWSWRVHTSLPMMTRFHFSSRSGIHHHFPNQQRMVYWSLAPSISHCAILSPVFRNTKRAVCLSMENRLERHWDSVCHVGFRTLPPTPLFCG